MNNMTEWTVAYRAVSEPVFHRIDVVLTRDDADVLAGDVQNALPPNYEVRTTPTRGAELAGRGPHEEVLTVIAEDGTPIRIIDDARLLEALCMRPRATASPGG